ncbi:MAG: hypothetical protein ACLSTO_01145 [Bilophila wadsworthia]
MAASSASAVAGAFGKALGWVWKALRLVDMLPDWALEKLGWKRLRCGRGGRYARIPRSVRPRRAGTLAGNGGSGYGGSSSGNVPPGMLGGGFRCGRFSGGAWGAGSVGGTPSDGAFAGALREAWYGRLRAGSLGGRSSAVHSSRALPAAPSGGLREAPDREGRWGRFRAGLFGPGFGTQPFFSLHGSLPDGRPVAVGGDGLAGGAVSLESRRKSTPAAQARRMRWPAASPWNRTTSTRI